MKLMRNFMSFRLLFSSHSTLLQSHDAIEFFKKACTFSHLVHFIIYCIACMHPDVKWIWQHDIVIKTNTFITFPPKVQDHTTPRVRKTREKESIGLLSNFTFQLLSEHPFVKYSLCQYACPGHSPPSSWRSNDSRSQHMWWLISHPGIQHWYLKLKIWSHFIHLFVCHPPHYGIWSKPNFQATKTWAQTVRNATTRWRMNELPRSVSGACLLVTVHVYSNCF